MSGQRGLGRTHRPDMEIIHLLDALDRQQVLLNRMDIDMVRDGIKRQVDGILQDTPGLPGHNDDDQEAHDRIDPIIACQFDQETTNHHVQGDASINAGPPGQQNVAAKTGL